MTNFSVKFDISNITDEPEFYYWGHLIDYLSMMFMEPLIQLA